MPKRKSVKVKKFMDIEFNPRLINVHVVAESVGYTARYVQYLLDGARRGKTARIKVRNAMLKLYQNAVTVTNKNTKIGN